MQKLIGEILGDIGLETAPISNWELPQTDIGFGHGQSGFGYGDNDDNTEIPQTVSVYVRKEFEIEDPSIILKALFHIDYDDGYIAYLNGIEFFRRNLGSTGSTVYNTQLQTVCMKQKFMLVAFLKQ